jgi:single-strand DNA-binding protein
LLSACTAETVQKKNGTSYELTEYHQVQVPEEAMLTLKQPLRKGQTVFLEGKMRTHGYYNAQQQKAFSLKIFATKLSILSDAAGNLAVPDPASSVGNNSKSE